MLLAAKPTNFSLDVGDLGDDIEEHGHIRRYNDHGAALGQRALGRSPVDNVNLINSFSAECSDSGQLGTGAGLAMGSGGLDISTAASAYAVLCCQRSETSCAAEKKTSVSQH